MKHFTQHIMASNSPAVPTRSAMSNTKLLEFVGTGKDFIPSEAPTLRAVIRKGVQIQENNLHNNIGTSLPDLILWDKTKSYESIFTSKMSSDTIKSFRNSPMKVQHFPIHSQSTERAVQNVSKSCMLVYGQEKRVGFVKGMLAHREHFPVIESKKTLV